MGDRNPAIVPNVKPKPDEKPAKPQAVIENPGEAGAKILDSIVAKLRAGGHNMVLVRATIRVETHALIKDNKLFGDDEEHEGTLIFEGELEREQ